MPDQDSNPDSAEDSIPDAGDDNPSTSEVDSATASGSDDEETAEAGSETIDGVQLEEENLGETLRNADDDELDDAPFGIIRVDDEGKVEFYNQFEAELSGMDPEEVKGKNFFTQVAPCTNNRLFRGRFKKGVRRDELDETFTYTYTYKMRPTLVDVRLYRDEAGQNWIVVQKY